MTVAYEIPVLDQTVEAAGTITQYRFVKLDSVNTTTRQVKVVQCTATTDKPWGVAQEGASSGGTLSVRRLGVTKLEADAAITVDAAIGTSADGQGVTKTYGTDTTHFVCGRADAASTAAAQLISCAVDCIAPHRAA